MNHFLVKYKWQYALLLFSVFSLTTHRINGQALPYFQLGGYSWDQLNPAYHQVLDRGQFQVLHRKQSPIPGVDYRQTAVTFASPQLFSNEKMGFSINYVNDDFSNKQYQQTHILQGAFSYTLSLNKSQRLSLGMGLSYFQQQWGNTYYTTGSQWVPNFGYDPSLPTGELPTIANNIDYIALNTGIFWAYRTDPQARASYYLGLSGYFLNKPRFMIDTTPNYLQTLYQLQVGSTHDLSDAWQLLPQLFFKQDYKESWINVGTALKYNFENYNPNDPIGSGALALSLNAENRGILAFGFCFEQNAFAIGASYEIVLDKTQFVQQPAFEAGITIYPFKQQRTRKKQNVPKTAQEEQAWIAYEKRFEQLDNPQKNTAEEEIYTDRKFEEASIEAIKKAKMTPIKYTLYFEFNQIVLDKLSQKQLDYTIQLLKDNPQLHVDVVGHADNIGNYEAKEKVAWFRANYVYRYLKKNGIKKEQLKLESKADQEPLVPNDSAENRAKNRRVELLIFEP